VKPLAYPLLTDENIHPDVVTELRRQGKDVVTAIEMGLGGKMDTIVLATAVAHGRAIITHDSDFGLLAVNAGELSVGLIYLRPGHIQAAHTLQSLRAIEATVGEVEPGFVVVAEHRPGQVRVRLRVSSRAAGHE
jgi:predicted nuclease of predicted toxin-antitoxin system